MSHYFTSFIKSLVYPSSYYKVVHYISGHRQPVTALSIGADGEFLASGGYDGVRLWHLVDRRAMSTPQRHPFPVVTALLWVPGFDRVARLVIGSADGRVFLWSNSPHYSRYFEGVQEILHGNGGSPVTSFALSMTGMYPRVAACFEDGEVRLWCLTGSPRILQTRWRLCLTGALPCGLAFIGPDETELILADGKNGKIYRIDAAVGEARVLGSVGGIAYGSFAAHHTWNRDLFIISNILDAIDLYSAQGCEWMHRMYIGDVQAAYPKQVAFADDGKSIVAGSDHGILYLFSSDTGKRIDRLRSKHSEAFQTVTAFSSRQRNIIVAARSSEAGEIVVWAKEGGIPLFSNVIVLVCLCLCIAAFGLLLKMVEMMDRDYFNMLVTPGYWVWIA